MIELCLSCKQGMDKICQLTQFNPVDRCWNIRVSFFLSISCSGESWLCFIVHGLNSFLFILTQLFFFQPGLPESAVTIHGWLVIPQVSESSLRCFISAGYIFSGVYNILSIYHFNFSFKWFPFPWIFDFCYVCCINEEFIIRKFILSICSSWRCSLHKHAKFLLAVYVQC